MMRPAIAFLIALLGCSESPAPVPRAPTPVEPTPAAPIAQAPAEPPPPAIDERFSADLLAAAADYRAWGRVDERPNLAPTLCRAPMGDDFGVPSHVRLSKVGDASPHGKKLYYLYAKHRSNYLALGHTDREAYAGQVIVKQSWTVKELDSAPDGTDLSAHLGPITWLRTKDGTVLSTDRQADLFIMMRVPDDVTDTDEGWVYGTVTADGQRVTSAGRIDGCMGCHQDAPHERLFGLQKTPRLDAPKSIFQ